MEAFEKFTSFFPDIPHEALQRLDRNFQRVSRLTTFGPEAVTTAYTFKDTDTIDSLQVDATSGGITIKLPASPTGNQRRRVIKTDASVNAVTVSGNGSLINGSATFSLSAQYAFIEVEPTGTSWLIVSRYP